MYMAYASNPRLPKLRMEAVMRVRRGGGIRVVALHYGYEPSIVMGWIRRVDVEFIPRTNHKTPDFVIDGAMWELKSPTGTGKRNIERQLQAGIKQSKNIVFDARRSKIHITKIRRTLSYQFRLAKTIKRIILIDKVDAFLR